MARLLADQDFKGSICRELKRLGHDILIPADLGWAQTKIDDSAILKHAVAGKRILLTHNGWHFGMLHRQSNAHFGIVVCSQHAQWNSVLSNLQRALSELSWIDGILLRVNRDNYFIG